MGCANSDNSVLQVAKQWGSDEFSSEKWIKANESERAKMVYSFLENHDIDNMTLKQIRSVLGHGDGLYGYNDITPAYNVASNQNNYIVAFPYDPKTKVITSVVIEPAPKRIHTQGTIMFVGEFGKNNFSMTKWKEANSNQRASMMFSFLTKNDIYKMSDSDIKKKLGQPDIHYNNNSAPAYLLTHGGVNYAISFPYIDTEMSGKILEAVIEPYTKITSFKPR